MSEVYSNHNTVRRVFCKWSLRPVQAGHPNHCPDGCPDSRILAGASPRHAAELGSALEQLERMPSTPAVELATAWRGTVMGPGEMIGGVGVPLDKLGLYLGNPKTGTVLVLGDLKELQAWVENLRWMLVDIPTVAQCLHCKLEIIKAGPGQPWRDRGDLVECQARRGALVHEPMEAAT